jgi:CYTH domain-containing protein
MMRTLADEALAPKYAHVERERRWLVRADATPEERAFRCLLIEDRYIHGTRMRLRRMTDVATGQQSLKLGKKYEAGDVLARPTVTAYLSDDEYRLLATLPAHALVKRRYELETEGLHYNVDRFEGALAWLRLSEIEMEDDAALRALEAPSWAGREVSHDERYQGGMLALHGRTQE